MPSAFGWLDADSQQRQKMLEVVDLFREEGTVDDLGVGAIRDALSDILFPEPPSCTPSCATSCSSPG